MGNSIKYLNYEVVREGTVVNKGIVPAMIAVGGSNKNYDLAGIWLTHSADEVTELKITNSEEKVDITLFSDSKKTTWLEYMGRK